MIKVYQVQLTDAMIDEVNAKGWGGTSWDRNYHRLTNFPGKNARVEDQFLEAVEAGLVTHTMIVNSNEIDDVFAAGNGMGGAEIVWQTCHKSISIGDLLVTETGEGYIIGRFGFKPVSKQMVRIMETMVSTHMVGLSEA